MANLWAKQERLAFRDPRAEQPLAVNNIELSLKMRRVFYRMEREHVSLDDAARFAAEFDLASPLVAKELIALNRWPGEAHIDSSMRMYARAALAFCRANMKNIVNEQLAFKPNADETARLLNVLAIVNRLDGVDLLALYLTDRRLLTPQTRKPDMEAVDPTDRVCDYAYIGLTHILITHKVAGIDRRSYPNFYGDITHPQRDAYIKRLMHFLDADWAKQKLAPPPTT